MMRRVLFDLNILLDMLGEREPFFADASRLWTLAEKRKIEGVVCALSVPTAYYIIRKAVGHAKAMSSVKAISRIFEVVPLDHSIIGQAIELQFPDFEDGLQSCAALHANVDVIVTRDLRGFRKSEVPVMSPSKLLATIRDRNGDHEG